MKQTIALLLMAIITVNASAQEAPPAIKKIQITSLSVLTSAFIESSETGTIEDFYALAPNSKLLPSDLSDYSTNSGFYGNGSFASTILMGFKFSNKDKSAYKPNPILRVGLTYMNGTSLSASAYKDDRFAYDTLTSSNTGESFPVDSISTTGYNMTYTSQQIRLDASLTYRTNPEARWSLFAGFGITFGGSINTKTNIQYSQYSYISPTTNSQVGYYNQNYMGEYDTESFNNSNNIAFSAYIPLGVDFRIANNSEFWQRVHLFYEMRPTLNMTSISELRTITNPAFQHGIGLKVQWN